MYDVCISIFIIERYSTLCMVRAAAAGLLCLCDYVVYGERKIFIPEKSKKKKKKNGEERIKIVFNNIFEYVYANEDIIYDAISLLSWVRIFMVLYLNSTLFFALDTSLSHRVLRYELQCEILFFYFLPFVRKHSRQKHHIPNRLKFSNAEKSSRKQRTWKVVIGFSTMNIAHIICHRIHSVTTFVFLNNTYIRKFNSHRQLNHTERTLKKKRKRKCHHSSSGSITAKNHKNENRNQKKKEKNASKWYVQTFIRDEFEILPLSMQNPTVGIIFLSLGISPFVDFIIYSGECIEFMTATQNCKCKKKEENKIVRTCASVSERNYNWIFSLCLFPP